MVKIIAEVAQGYEYFDKAKKMLKGNIKKVDALKFQKIYADEFAQKNIIINFSKSLEMDVEKWKKF